MLAPFLLLHAAPTSGETYVLPVQVTWDAEAGSKTPRTLLPLGAAGRLWEGGPCEESPLLWLCRGATISDLIKASLFLLAYLQ